MTTLMCLAMLVIAGCQCFHVFKLYSRLVAMEMLLNSILNTQNIKHFEKIKAVEPEVKRKAGANRAPRTEEQKKQAAEQRRLWWERKRALDAQKAAEPKPTETKLDS